MPTFPELRVEWLARRRRLDRDRRPNLRVRKTPFPRPRRTRESRRPTRLVRRPRKDRTALRENLLRLLRSRPRI